jgi:hypothetical protein
METIVNDGVGRFDEREAARAAGALGKCFDDHRARLQAIELRQQRIEALLDAIKLLVTEIRNESSSGHLKKNWYSPAEAAKILGKRPYTVREWCRFGRINARKRPGGRGDAAEWEVSAEEIERYRDHGLLPIPKRRFSSG